MLFEQVVLVIHRKSQHAFLQRDYPHTLLDL